MLENQVAIVTGSSRGIGKEIALELARMGADVVVNDLSASEAAKEVAKEIEAMGRKAMVIAADVSNSDDAKNLVNTTVKEMGRVDILVNNAGITRDGLLLRMSEADFDSVINVNLKGAFNTIKHITPVMLKQRSGRIVNMASVVGLMGNAGQVNYCASKAGIIGMTKAAARELGSRGITVNAIAPGFINTQMTEVLPEEVKKTYMTQIPLGRFGDVSDIAKTVGFLVSDGAAYITGQVISVNGGMYM
ncbi:MAG: 3-oxoacyl-[acyl-carrier-protein] reductase [Lachnospiraceae bacterium]|nr:3-oxoacyl-[acyl-carrier-protein] reductase [Lachnospiraceae bacterium]